MKKHEELSDPNSCWNKAADDEPVFVIRAKDPEAVGTVMEWCNRRIRHNHNSSGDKKLRDAVEWCRLAAAWRVSNAPFDIELTREEELEDLLMSAKAIAERCGDNTAWERFAERLTAAGISSVTAKVFKILESDKEEVAAVLPQPERRIVYRAAAVRLNGEPFRFDNPERKELAGAVADARFASNRLTIVQRNQVKFWVRMWEMTGDQWIAVGDSTPVD